MAHSLSTHESSYFLTKTPRHTIRTRALHACLAFAIIAQLVSSLFMNPDDGGNEIFSIHKYIGLSAFFLILAFWLQTIFRKHGTSFGMLFPWLRRARLAAVWTDLRTHLAAMQHLTLPEHDGHSPLASAVHGLGLLLMTAMAASGTLYYFINTGDPDGPGFVKVAMTIHLALANLVWVYLIGHASMAVIAHYSSVLSLHEMWSFHRKTDVK